MSGRPSWKSAEIGLFRPFFAFFALFRRARRAPGKSRKRRKKAFFLRCPQICLNPHLLNPHLLGHTPSTAGTFQKKFRKNSGKTPETLSERFLEFPSRVRLGCPKPYNSRHLRLPERFQNSLPPSTAGDASFFRIGSGEGLSELVMEFPAVLGVFLNLRHPKKKNFGIFLNFRGFPHRRVPKSSKAAPSISDRNRSQTLRLQELAQKEPLFSQKNGPAQVQYEGVFFRSPLIYALNS